MTAARAIDRAALGTVFVLLALTVVFFRLLPFSGMPGGWPGPDLLLALTFAWIIRRPDTLPVLLVAAVSFFADLLLSRPPGLAAALTVAATELLRRRDLPGPGASLALETGLVAMLLFAIAALSWVALAVTVAGQPPLGAQLLQMAVTCASYPFVAMALSMGIGRRDPGRSGR